MENWKRYKKIIIFIASGVIGVPLISHYLNALGKSMNTQFWIGTSIIIWLVLSFIIILLKNNIVTTKQNAKIEVEGINLKKKDGTFGTADWGTKEEIEEYLGINKRDGIILRWNRREWNNNFTIKYILK